MVELVESIVVGIVTGGVMSSILGFLFHKRTERISEEIKSQYEKSVAIFQSKRLWKEKSVSELLGPLYMQFDRTRRAFLRWKEKNLYLEAKVIREGNIAVRDLLLLKPHLIPPKLLGDAGELVEHYDRWLEEFEKLRGREDPDLDTSFVFVGPQGFPFPKSAEANFKMAFEGIWEDLYAPDRKVRAPWQAEATRAPRDGVNE